MLDTLMPWLLRFVFGFAIGSTGALLVHLLLNVFV
jgi:hypothetical protein